MKRVPVPDSRSTGLLAWRGLSIPAPRRVRLGCGDVRVFECALRRLTAFGARRHRERGAGVRPARARRCGAYRGTSRSTGRRCRDLAGEPAISGRRCGKRARCSRGHPNSPRRGAGCSGLGACRVSLRGTIREDTDARRAKRRTRQKVQHDKEDRGEEIAPGAAETPQPGRKPKMEEHAADDGPTYESAE